MTEDVLSIVEYATLITMTNFKRRIRTEKLSKTPPAKIFMIYIILQ